MQINKISIQNYKMFNNLEICDLSKYSQIIGKNDSGKSTVINAIKKVLVSNYANQEFTTDDSYYGNLQDIKIECILECKNIEKLKDKRVLYDSLLPHLIAPGYILKLSLKAVYNIEESRYETFYYINDEEVKNLNSICSNFNIIELNSTYDYDKSLSKLKNKQRAFNKKNKYNTDDMEYKKLVHDLDEGLSELDSFKRFDNSLNIDTYKNLFGNNINISSNMNLKDVYEGLSLSIFNKLDNENYFKSEIENIGDGRRKILSNELEISSETIDLKEQIHIVLLEEPENHLFIELQKMYLSEMTNNKLIHQVVITTHSPALLKFLNEFSVIKLNFNKQEYIAASYVEKSYLFNTKVAESCFSDGLLLVEGPSEEIFYSYLIENYGEFQTKMHKNSMNIINIMGINFKSYLKLLRNLSITFYIKTDNDFTKNKKGQYSFTGINRGLSYLGADESIELYMKMKDFSQDACDILGVECKDGELKLKWYIHQDEFNKNDWKELNIDFIKHITADDKNAKEVLELLNIILDYLKSEKIYISNHFDGFEQDLLNLLNCDNQGEIYSTLKKAKAKNLERYLYDESEDQKLKIQLDSILQKSLVENMSNSHHIFSFLENLND